MVDVSYEPSLPATQTCVKPSLIPNRCCGENRARRVIHASYTLNVIKIQAALHIHIYKHTLTLTHIYGVCILLGRDKRLFLQRTEDTARTLFSKMQENKI